MAILNALSPGNGMAAYLQIHKKYLENADGVEGEFINIKLAELSDVMYETNRKVSAYWTNGSRNARGLNKGVRMSSGKMIVQVIEEDFISKLQKSLNFTGEDGKQKSNSLKNYYTFGTMKPIQTKDSENTLSKESTKIKYADEIPFCNLIIVAKGDHQTINKDGATTFKPEEIVQLKFKGVKFLTDLFSVAVGQRISDKVLDIIIFQGIEDWKVI